MENLEGSVEELVSHYAHGFFYTTVRSATLTKDAPFSQLPLAIIRPAEITAIEGGERCRVSVGLDVVAMKFCLSGSDEEIAEVYKTIREDFILLATIMKMDGEVVDVGEVTVEMVEDKQVPRVYVAANVRLEFVIGMFAS